jgi:parallel beta-helix repeat protein
MKRHASPTGNDATGTGTRAGPYRTVNRLVEALDTNDIGVLHQGVYETPSASVRAPGATLTSPLGQHATIRGRLRVERSATGATVKGLILDGRTGSDLPTPLIYADDFTLDECDVSNHNTAIGVHATDYYDYQGCKRLRVEGCRIHHNGILPAQNYDHGIYLGHTEGATIRGNWIFANADRGVQLYSNSDGCLIENNVIDSNGMGVGIGGDSAGNIIRGNWITNSTLGFNVYGLNDVSPRNEVRGNVLWSDRTDYYGGDPDHSGLQPESLGLTGTANTITKPTYRNPAKFDYRVTNGPALAKWLREL